MSDRQIAATVRFGRKVTLWPVDQDPISGYVAGLDRYTFFVLVPNNAQDPNPEQPVLRKYLVHKSGTLIELHDESTLDAEPEAIRDALRKIIMPFRTKIMDDFYPDVQRHGGRGAID